MLGRVSRVTDGKVGETERRARVTDGTGKATDRNVQATERTDEVTDKIQGDGKNRRSAG
ncbi:hypothetical protein ACIQGW_02370 [Lysinibacillus xylanilyticus]|uniref:hypothetical protein n=1 Tax=Lysinibacillus xylanilyticus TaxID=582475 RepID=UPI0037FA59E9